MENSLPGAAPAGPYPVLGHIPLVAPRPWKRWRRGVLGRELLVSPSCGEWSQQGAGEEVDVIGLTWDPPTHVPSPTKDTWDMTFLSRGTSSLLLLDFLWPVTCCFQPWEGFGMRLLGLGRSMSSSMTIPVLLLLFLSILLSRQSSFLQCFNIAALFVCVSWPLHWRWDNQHARADSWGCQEWHHLSSRAVLWGFAVNFDF